MVIDWAILAIYVPVFTTVKVNRQLQVGNTMVTSRMGLSMDMAVLFTLTEVHTSENGKTIFFTEEEFSILKMEIDLKVISSLVYNMAKAFTLDNQVNSQSKFGTGVIK